MNSHGTLGFKPAGEPSGLNRIDDSEVRRSGNGGSGRAHGGRSFRNVWHRRVARRPPGAQYPPGDDQLSAVEERMLAERGKAGDVDAEQQLVTANLRLVLHAVRDYRRCGVPVDDLIQEGNLGLIRAARNFDPLTHSARFATYATYWIRCFIVRALASNGSLIHRPEHAQLLRLQYREAVDALRARRAAAGSEPGSPSPTLEEVSQYLGVPAHRLEEANLIQSDQAVCQSLADLTLADGPAPEDSLVITEDRAMVGAALRRLSPFEAWVICERFGLDKPHGRGIRQAPIVRASSEETTGSASRANSSADPSVRSSRSREAYFERSYNDMGRDCGLSVFRLRQVEKTALAKLRGFLALRMTDES